MSHRKHPSSLAHDQMLDASDIWVVPPQGRVVFDARGNSVWQWPGQNDPFAEHSSLESMNAHELRVVEPAEIRRSNLPWMHESERPARVYRLKNDR